MPTISWERHKNFVFGKSKIQKIVGFSLFLIIAVVFILLVVDSKWKIVMTAFVSLISWWLKPLFTSSSSRVAKYNLPLPQRMHVVISPDSGTKVFVVGDVHGCLNELKELLQKADVGIDANSLTLFVGDIVNKGPKSLEVLRFVRAMGPSALCIRGNNEEAVLREYFRLKKDSLYNLPERYDWIRELTDDEVTYLVDMPYTIELPVFNALIVHAGLVPGKTLEDQIPSDMTDMRNLIQEDYFLGRGLYASENTDKGVAWASLWPGPEYVYFGHDARRRLQLFPFATGLDTGCVYGGQLTGQYLTGDRERISVQSQFNCLKNEE